jgi:hypothetical protein
MAVKAAPGRAGPLSVKANQPADQSSGLDPFEGGVEQSAVQHRLEPAPQTLQLEGVSRREPNLDPTVVGLRSGDRQRGFLIAPATSSPSRPSRR